LVGLYLLWATAKRPFAVSPGGASVSQINTCFRVEAGSKANPSTSHVMPGDRLFAFPSFNDATMSAISRFIPDGIPAPERPRDRGRGSRSPA
jgi:hypothetical protein